MAAKKKTPKQLSRASDFQRLQDADRRNDALAARMEATERILLAHNGDLVVAEARIDQLEEHALELRKCMVATWRVNDLLRDMVAGARQMPDGRPYREHFRDELVGGWSRIVPELPETNLNEDGPER